MKKTGPAQKAQSLVCTPRSAWAALPVLLFAGSGSLLNSQETTSIASTTSATSGFEALPIDALKAMAERNNQMEKLREASKEGLVAFYLSPRDNRWPAPLRSRT